MNKSKRKERMNTCLRKALNKLYSSSDITQDKLAEKLCISSRACSALLDGKYGFSALSVLLLFSLLPTSERVFLLNDCVQLCKVLTKKPRKEVTLFAKWTATTWRMT